MGWFNHQLVFVKFFFQQLELVVVVYTLPETNSSHLKMDDWKTIVAFGISAYFQVRKCYIVSGRVPQVLVCFDWR